MCEPLVECLLQVTASDTAALNAFDKLFRSGTGPQWSDCAGDGTPHYSLHALFPVPEDVQRRGYQLAGHLWCKEFWDTPDDLTGMQVKRLLHERRYRFYTKVDAPKNVIWKISYDLPVLHLRLILLGTDKPDLQIHAYYEGIYQSTYSPQGAEEFAVLRKEMGF